MKRVLLVAPLPPPYGGISHWAAMVMRHSQGEGRVPLEVVDIAPRHRSEFELSFAKRVLRGVPDLFWQLIKVLKELPSKDVLALHVTTSKDRKFYRVVEAWRTENGRCILVTGPKERVSRGPGFVGARFGT